MSDTIDKPDAPVSNAALVLESTITCPNCGHRAAEIMPTDACQFFYDCKACGARLRPKAGDCCVFCSYGTVPCPPVQAAGGAPGCCARGEGAVATAEIRPGIERPDWKVVARPAARDALLARSHSRPGPVETWSAALQPVQDSVWRATIALFARLGRPPGWAEIAEETNLGEHTVEAILLELESRDLLAADRDCRSISYAYPFTAQRNGHRVKIYGHELHALCAIDALGTGAMCGVNAVVESSCRTCATLISIETTERGTALGAVRPDAPLVWYDLTHDRSAANSCCKSIAFFCCSDHLAQWTATQTTPPAGRRLAIADAFEVGRALFEPVLRTAIDTRP